MREKYKIPRKQFQAYSLHESSSGIYWKPMPLQIDPLDQWGRMLFPDPKSYLNENLKQKDRIAVDPNFMTKIRYPKGKRLPCKADQGVELFSSGKYGYVFLCDATQLLPPRPSPIQYDMEKGKVSSQFFYYEHRQKNHLMFESLGFVDEKTGPLVAAARSDQLIFADIKNFINLSFDADDVEAKLQSLRYAPLGMIGLLQFYLSILALKIELSLTPEVQFFENSLYMPMSLHYPVTAKDYLNPNSAVYYTWETPSHITWDWEKSSLPFEDAAKPLSLAPYCNRHSCKFSLVGKSESTYFTLQFVIPYQLASLGFFPKLMRDARVEEKKIDQKISKYGVKDRIGLVFATDGLPKGNHDWDFWVYFGEPERQCPSPLRIRRMRGI